MPEQNFASHTTWLRNQASELDPKRLWRILQSKRWLIFTFVAVAFSGSFIYAFQMPRFYIAYVSILVENVKDKALPFDEVLMPESAAELTYYQTQVELLTNRTILEIAAEDLNLLSHYKKRHSRLQTAADAAKILQKNVHAKVLRGTQIIQLSVQDQDPQMAAKIANTIAETYLKESLRDRLFVSEQILKWFPDEANTLKKNSPIEQLRRLDRSDITSALPTVMRDPVIGKIKEDRLALDAQIRELSRRYTNEHPKMKELLARADYLESEMKVQTDKVISGIKAGLTGVFNVTNLKVVEDAVPPKKPAGPRRLFIIFVSTFSALLAGVFLAYFLDSVDHTIKSEEDVRDLSLSFLGYMPLVKHLTSGKGSFSNLLDRVHPHPGLMDDITNFRISILFSLPANRGKRLMCTSTIPEEGKTTIACLLALSIADFGERVLIIDADLRKPAVHTRFGIKPKPGLSNCLTGSIDPREAIEVAANQPRLHILPAGEHTPNPAMLLHSDNLEQLIQTLEPHYDRIIFDVPPAFHIPDGLILAQKMHGTILIFGMGMVPLALGRKMKEKFGQTQNNIIGAIINRVDYRKLDAGYDYNYYHYYSRYQKYYHRPDGVAEPPNGPTKDSEPVVNTPA